MPLFRRWRLPWNRDPNWKASSEGFGEELRLAEAVSLLSWLLETTIPLTPRESQLHWISTQLSEIDGVWVSPEPWALKSQPQIRMQNGYPPWLHKQDYKTGGDKLK